MVLVRAGFTVVSMCTREQIASLPSEPAFRLAVIGRTIGSISSCTGASDRCTSWADRGGRLSRKAKLPMVASVPS